MVLPFLAAIAPFAPLIGGAISAAGSLFAPKPKATKQTETVTNSIDLGKLRADAEAHGFNPLTIIRGGGLAGYTNSTGVMSMPAGADMRLSNAFQVFGSAVSQWQYDPYGQEKSQMELRLAEAQIRALNSGGGAGPNMSLQTPSASGSPTGDSYVAGGLRWEKSPLMDDAQVIEDRHGDIASWFYGIGTLAADASHNLYKWSHAWGREAGKTVAEWELGGKDAWVQQFDRDWDARRKSFDLSGNGL